MNARSDKPRPSAVPDLALELEVKAIVAELRAAGRRGLTRTQLQNHLGADRWGPRRFDNALAAAVRQGLVEPRQHRYVAVDDGANPS